MADQNSYIMPVECAVNCTSLQYESIPPRKVSPDLHNLIPVRNTCQYTCLEMFIWLSLFASVTMDVCRCVFNLHGCLSLSLGLHDCLSLSSCLLSLCLCPLSLFVTMAVCLCLCVSGLFVCVFMSLCLSVSMVACVSLCVSISVCLCLCVSMCGCLSVSVCLRVWLFVSISLCLFVSSHEFLIRAHRALLMSFLSDLDVMLAICLSVSSVNQLLVF